MNKEISDNNKLVIIGNGFDLAHGLKTRYSDFIEEVWNDVFINYHAQKPLKYSLFTINDKVPRKVFKDLEHFKRTSIMPTSSPTIIKNPCHSELIPSQKYNPNWSNLELNYFRQLKRYYKEDLREDKVKIFNNYFSKVKINFEEYLSEISKESIVEKNQYIETKILQNLKTKVDAGNIVNPIHILNFNYTKTFEPYIGKNKMDINFIHGRLKEPNNPIIFGYGDESDEYYKQIENRGQNEYLKHFKSFGYFKTENYQRLLKFLDFYKYDVLILGHSCGLSDRVMLKTIFEHQNCEQIQIFYHQWGEESWQNDFEEKTMEISRHFSDKAQMRKKVRPFNLSIPLTPYKPEK